MGNHYTVKVTDVVFSVLAQNSKKVNNFSDSATEAYLNYSCYKEFINIFDNVTKITSWLNSLDYTVTESYLD